MERFLLTTHFLTFISFFPSPPQAPFTPFITEMMYQNLQHLIDPVSVEEKDATSIHYLMLPQVRWEKFTSSFCCRASCNHFVCRDADLATLSKHQRIVKYHYLAWPVVCLNPIIWCKLYVNDSSTANGAAPIAVSFPSCRDFL